MKQTFLTKLPGGIEISKNDLNWIVDTHGDKWYFQTLEGVADSLFELRLKNNAFKAKIKTDHIQKLIDCVAKARLDVLDDVKNIVYNVNPGDLKHESRSSVN